MIHICWIDELKWIDNWIELKFPVILCSWIKVWKSDPAEPSGERPLSRRRETTRRCRPLDDVGQETRITCWGTGEFNRCNCHVFTLTWSLSPAVCYLWLSLDPAYGPVSWSPQLLITDWTWLFFSRTFIGWPHSLHLSCLCTIHSIQVLNSCLLNFREALLSYLFSVYKVYLVVFHY